MKKVITSCFQLAVLIFISTVYANEVPAENCKEVAESRLQQKTEVCIDWGNQILVMQDAPKDLINEAAAANMFVAENIVKTNPPKSISHYSLSWDLAQKSQEPSFVALIAANYGVLLNSNSQFSQTLKISPIAIKAAKVISQEPNKSVLTFRLMNNYADALRLNKQFTEAKPIYQWLINASKNSLEANVYGTLLNNWAICLEKTKELDRANAVYAEAVRLTNESLDENSNLIKSNYAGFLAEFSTDLSQEKPAFVSIIGNGIKLPSDMLETK